MVRRHCRPHAVWMRLYKAQALAPAGSVVKRLVVMAQCRLRGGEGCRGLSVPGVVTAPHTSGHGGVCAGACKRRGVKGTSFRSEQRCPWAQEQEERSAHTQLCEHYRESNREHTRCFTHKRRAVAKYKMCQMWCALAPQSREAPRVATERDCSKTARDELWDIGLGQMTAAASSMCCACSVNVSGLALGMTRSPCPPLALMQDSFAC